MIKRTTNIAIAALLLLVAIVWVTGIGTSAASVGADAPRGHSGLIVDY